MHTMLKLYKCNLLADAYDALHEKFKTKSVERSRLFAFIDHRPGDASDTTIRNIVQHA